MLTPGKNILGLSAYYHDSAAALLRDGAISAAAQEERFTRKKHDARFPEHAIKYCLREAGLSLGDIDQIVFYDKPLVKFERLLETYLSYAPNGIRSFIAAMPICPNTSPYTCTVTLGIGTPSAPPWPSPTPVSCEMIAARY